MRRRRSSAWVRDLVAQTVVTPADLILPIFICEGKGQGGIIAPRMSVDGVVTAAKEARALGVCAVMLFPVIDDTRKTEDGRHCADADNVLCRAVAEVKSAVPDIGVICDVALDPYTTHGQDGIFRDGRVINDETVDMLQRQAVTLAASGCDIVAPSDMMDGRIGAIRTAMDGSGAQHVMILSYAAKYASSLYGPFRDNVGSAACLGAADKLSYQMDPRNSCEALDEVTLDIAEGADMLMIKPATAYLDILYRTSQATNLPVFTYHVSGEYMMLKEAAKQGYLDFDKAYMEVLQSCKRAGARAIVTYGAMDVARSL